MLRRRNIPAILLALCGAHGLMAQDAAPQPDPPAATAGGALEAPAGGVGLSLSEVIAQALTHNIGIRAAALDPQARALTVSAARGMFDPSLRLGFSGSKSASPCFTVQECPDGEPLILRFDTTASLGLVQLTPLGGTVGISAAATTPVFSSAANFQNPGLTTSAYLTVNQPLLRGAGYRINRVDIIRALMEQEVSWETLRTQVQQLIIQVHDAYWTLAARRRSLELRRQSLEFARRQAEMTRERIELGFAAPVEIYAVDQGVATREAEVEMALNDLRSAEIALRALLGMEVVGVDAQAPLMATDPPPTAEIRFDRDEALAMALERDPALDRARRQVEIQALVVRDARNGRLPALDFAGSVGVTDSASSDVEPEPIWNAGLVLSTPLGNRQARARHQSAALDLRRAELAVAQREQEVQVSVDAAIREVETARLRIELGTRARELADRKLEAERERLERGESTLKNVLDYLEDRDQARLSELQARIDLAGALIRLDALRGTLLPDFGVDLAEVGVGGEDHPGPPRGQEG